MCHLTGIQPVKKIDWLVIAANDFSMVGKLFLGIPVIGVIIGPQIRLLVNSVVIFQPYCCHTRQLSCLSTVSSCHRPPVTVTGPVSEASQILPKKLPMTLAHDRVFL